MGRMSGGRRWTGARVSAAVAALAIALALAIQTAAAPAKPAAAAKQAAPEGAMTALTGPGGCLGVGAHCGRLRGVQGNVTPVISPDGRSVYLLGDQRGIAVLRRDRRSGRLTQLAGRAGCLVARPLAGCTTVPELPRITVPTLQGPVGAVTPDGSELDVTTATGVVSFTRDPASGALTAIAGPKGCVDATRTTACAALTGLTHPTDLVVAGNGTLYVAGDFHGATGAIVALHRDPVTGALTQQPGCLNAGGSQGCGAAPCLAIETSLALSPDGSVLYAGSTESLDNESTGTGTVLSLRAAAPAPLTVLGCVHRPEATSDVVAPAGTDDVLASTLSGNRGTGIEYSTLDLYRATASGSLARGRRLGCTGNRRCSGLVLGPDISQLAAAPDGRTIYVSYWDSGVEALRLRNGKLTPLPLASGCLAARNAYQPPRRCRRLPSSITDGMGVSADGRNLYVTTYRSRDNTEAITSGVQVLRLSGPPS